jgi:hypothetical protein
VESAPPLPQATTDQRYRLNRIAVNPALSVIVIEHKIPAQSLNTLYTLEMQRQKLVPEAV